MAPSVIIKVFVDALSKTKECTNFQNDVFKQQSYTSVRFSPISSSNLHISSILFACVQFWPGPALLLSVRSQAWSRKPRLCARLPRTARRPLEYEYARVPSSSPVTVSLAQLQVHPSVSALWQVVGSFPHFSFKVSSVSQGLGKRTAGGIFLLSSAEAWSPWRQYEDLVQRPRPRALSQPPSGLHLPWPFCGDLHPSKAPVLQKPHIPIVSAAPTPTCTQGTSMDSLEACLLAAHVNADWSPCLRFLGCHLSAQLLQTSSCATKLWTSLLPREGQGDYKPEEEDNPKSRVTLRVYEHPLFHFFCWRTEVPCRTRKTGIGSWRGLRRESSTGLPGRRAKSLPCTWWGGRERCV